MFIHQVSYDMSKNEYHLKRQGAMYAIIATILLLMSRSLTSDYELTELFVAINHLLVFFIIILYLKSLSMIARLYKRPLKKDWLRIFVWFCFAMNILLTCIQFIAEKALLDNKLVTIITTVTSLPISLGVYCLYTRNASNNSKLKLHCMIGFGISMVYLVFRISYSILVFCMVPETNIAVTIFSKSSSISLLLYFYFLIMSAVYYSIARERDNNQTKKETEENT